MSKIDALASYLECDVDELSESSHDESLFEFGPSEFLVLTDREADDRWEDSLDNYIDECLLSEIPEWVQPYFDSEAWKRDARMDGRGHSLSSYDGNEDDTEDPETGEDLYVYRVN